MKKNDKVKIKKGTYRGARGTLKSRITETDTSRGTRRDCWTVDIGTALVLVYEDELK